MSRKFVALEEYDDFKKASVRAKELATQFNSFTRIKRTHKGWMVFVSSYVLTVLTLQPINRWTSCDDEFYAYDPEMASNYEGGATFGLQPYDWELDEGPSYQWTHADHEEESRKYTQQLIDELKEENGK